MLVAERWERILDTLAQTLGEVPVQKLAEITNVSVATIRRDLGRMAERGLITRTRGGAYCQRRVWKAPSLAESRGTNPEYKEAIGRSAASLIRPGDSVFIDGGYTTYQVARHLSVSPLIVATNALDVANILFGRPDVTLILLGGELNGSIGAAQGAMTETTIRELYMDKAVLGADAVSLNAGVATPILNVTRTKRCMVEQAREVIVVANHSKVGATAMYIAFPVERVHTLVTDEKADVDLLRGLRARGVRIIVAFLDGRTEEIR